MVKRNDIDESKKRENVTFKVEKEDQDSLESEAKDFSMLTRGFSRFMKSGRFNQRRNFKKDKEQKEDNSSEV